MIYSTNNFKNDKNNYVTIPCHREIIDICITLYICFTYVLMMYFFIAFLTYSCSFDLFITYLTLSWIVNKNKQYASIFSCKCRNKVTNLLYCSIVNKHFEVVLFKALRLFSHSLLFNITLYCANLKMIHMDAIK